MSTQTLPEVAAATTTWNIDPVHSNAEFKVRHMMISNVKGQFKGVTGTLKLDNAELTKSGVEVSIDAATINTNDAQRDAHLKSADFFDVEKFPTLTFKSTRVSRNGDGTLDGCGRPYHPWRDSQRDSGGRRAERSDEGPVGQHANRTLGDDPGEPEGFWPDLERGARNRRDHGERRSRHHPGYSIHQSVSVVQFVWSRV